MSKKFCSNCGEEREMEEVGFMPVWFTEGSKEDKWEHSFMCSTCGSLSAAETSEEAYKEATEAYKEMLIELDILTEDELEEKLS